MAETQTCVARGGGHAQAAAIDTHIREHCTREDLRRRDVSRHFGLSGRHLSRLLQLSYGMPFSGRLRHHRVERAKELLKADGVCVKEVAAAVGLRSYARLDEAFLAAEGMSPTQWRQQAAARGEGQEP